MQKWTPLIGGCAVGLVALTACSPPSANSPTTQGSRPQTSSQTPSGSATSPSGAAAVTSGTPQELATSAVATEALSDVFCEPDAAGVWSFSGTLSNPGSAPVKYTVAVAVRLTNSPAGHAMIEETVAPGAKVKVRADAFASGAPAGAKCEAVVSK